MFYVRVFTCVLYVNSRDSVNKFSVSTRVYRTLNHEFPFVKITCFLYVYSRDSANSCGILTCVYARVFTWFQYLTSRDSLKKIQGENYMFQHCFCIWNNLFSVLCEQISRWEHLFRYASLETCSTIDTAAQDSNPGTLSRESEVALATAPLRYYKHVKSCALTNAWTWLEIDWWRSRPVRRRSQLIPTID